MKHTNFHFKMSHIFEDNADNNVIEEDGSAFWLLFALGCFVLAIWFKRRRDRQQIENETTNNTINNSSNNITSSNLVFPSENWSHSSTNFPSSQETNQETFILIKIKWRDTTRNEYLNPLTTSIGDLKRICFSNELNQNLQVRLLFRGRILQNDSQTLEQIGIIEQGQTIMAIVSHAQQQQTDINNPQNNQTRATEFFNLIPGGENSLLFGSVGLALFCFWLLFFIHHDQFGNGLNYVLISIITVLYCFFVLTFFQNQRIQRATSSH
jgi:hypothetical protein